MSRSNAGFTLTEVVITVAIVAILASIALPSYRQYIYRANRSVAKNTASDLISRQEAFRTDRKRYATGLASLGFSADTLYLGRDGGLGASQNSDSIYQVALAGNPGSTACPPGGNASVTGFSVVLTPVQSQVGDTRCATLCESSAGVRGASGTGDDCWKR